jgi:predicted permease
LVTADLLEWSNARTIDAVASFSLGEARVTSNREAWYPRVARSSEPLDQILGVAPVLGRDFLPEDLEPGAAGVALLSDRTFRQRFGTDPGAIGSSIQFRDVFTNVLYTVIGVMPAGFRLSLPPEGQAPLEADLIVNRAVDPASLFSGSAVARLSAGASLEAARAELNAIMQANDDVGRTPSEILDRRLRLEPLHERVVGSSRFPLLVMWAAVAFVLMIACVNVANLLLARSAARSREVAIRTALGAGRLRLLRQQLTESVALAFAGGVAGVALAVLRLYALLDWMPLEIPRLRDAAVDESVLAFTVAVSAITGMVSGMASAWTASGTRPVATLANGALAGSRGRNRLHGLLVVSELALAMVLTLGAGLMVRSLWLIDAGIEEFALEHVFAARYETSPTVSAS